MTVGRFVRHGVYEKYLYRECLSIVRLRCLGCRATHALVPAFSVPGTSLGTCELEAFIAGRSEGSSRRTAGAALIARGVAVEYLRRIERMILTAIHRAKALFGEIPVHTREPYRWLRALTLGALHPIVVLNRRSTDNGYGALFCCLTADAGRRRGSAGIRTSHHNPSAAGIGPLLHSGYYHYP